MTVHELKWAMEEFNKRLDRFKFFDSFENPLLNITFRLETEDFHTYCKQKNLPPFHFFLYHLIKSLHQIENFKYRIHDGKVIKIDKIFGSYTVKNAEDLFNYTRFEYTEDLNEFIKRSLASKVEGEASLALINTGLELTPREMKNYVFITSIPWLDFTSIQHPIYKFKSADIPAIAWGKFTKTPTGLNIPFSVQAHHGFVDAFHMHLLADSIKNSINSSMN